MKNSYYAATYIEHFERDVVVEYETLTDHNGEPARDLCPIKKIRPYPAAIVGQFAPGDAVDVWFKHGWWKGTYQREEPNDDADLLHSVFMDYMPQGQQVGLFTTENIRIHQDFYFDDPTNYFGVWCYHHK